MTTYLVKNYALSITGSRRREIQNKSEETEKTSQEEEVYLFFPELYLKKVWKLTK